MRKKKTLIVGGSGQIGLYLSKYLLKKNYLVYVTTKKLKKKTMKNQDALVVKQVDKKNLKYLPFWDFYFDSGLGLVTLRHKLLC